MAGIFILLTDIELPQLTSDILINLTHKSSRLHLLTCHTRSTKYADAQEIISGAGLRELVDISRPPAGITSLPRLDTDFLLPFTAMSGKRVAIITGNSCTFACGNRGRHFFIYDTHADRRILGTQGTVVWMTPNCGTWQLRMRAIARNLVGPMLPMSFHTLAIRPHSISTAAQFWMHLDALSATVASSVSSYKAHYDSLPTL